MRNSHARAPKLTSVIRRKAICLAVTQGLLASTITQAAIIDVDSTSDVSGAGICTLRDAIASANTDSVVGGCSAGSGVDTITFDGVVAGDSITLANGELEVTTPMTIEGKAAGQPIIITGNGLSQVMVIDDTLFDSEIDVAVSNLLITGGYSSFRSGAGISSSENLSLSNMIVVGNTAKESGGGIYLARGTATITDSEIYFNTATFGGGGILSRGPDVTVTDSVIRNNELTNGSGAGILVDDGQFTLLRGTVSSNFTQGNTRSGGGLSFLGFGDQTDVNIVDSQITGNSAPVGGALSVRRGVNLLVSNSTLDSNTATATGSTDRGGAISANSNGNVGDDRFTISLVNSTLSNNSANRIGAIYASGGVVNISHVTVTGNSAVEGTAPNPVNLTGPVGGLQVGDSVSISNSIIANNTGLDCNDVLDPLVSNVNNLFGDGSCDTGAIGLVTGDPLLGPLQDNGGPTPTHALLAGSPALDAADIALCETKDQRGEDRDNNNCDIGAFEFVIPPTAIMVTTLQDNVVDDGFCSLREALSSANYDSAPYLSVGECAAGTGVDSIYFDQGILPGTITLTSGQLRISSALELVGPGADQLTISANASSRVLQVGQNGGSAPYDKVSVSGLTFSDGQEYGNAGIWNHEDLTISSCVITGNTATSNSGGGISSTLGSITIENSYVLYNSTPFFGGGINSNTSVVRIHNTTVYSNTGGGVYSFLGSADITESRLINNVEGAGFMGGGLAVTITDSNISNNYNDSMGGGVYLNKNNYGTSSMTISGSTISGNTARYYGGGINTIGESLTVTNSTISGNTAGRVGGGAFVRANGTLNLFNTTITENKSRGGLGSTRGAGLIQFFDGTIALSNSIIANNVGESECVFDTPSAVLINQSNLVEDGSCSEGAINFLSGDPGLGPLQDNGGPTQSHLPAVDSAVLNAGNDSNFASDFDQRGTGFPRIINSQIDIGAIEAPWLFGELAIDPASISVNEEDGMVNLTVNRTGGTDGDVTVRVDTTNDTAESPGDFTGISNGMLNIADGENSGVIQIAIIDDTLFEADESFTVTLSEPLGGATLGNTSSTVTIVSEDIPGVLAIDPSSISVNEKDGVASLTVNRSGGTDGDITVRFDTANDTAVSPDDFTGVSNGILNIADGENSGTIQITIVDDTSLEADESFTVMLSEPSGGATLGNASGTVTIVSEDVPGVLAIEPASISMDEESGNVQLSISRTGGSDGEVSVLINTLEDTATAGLDFTALVNEPVIFADGESDPKPVLIPLLSDDEAEVEEVFSVSISSPTGDATLGNTTSTVTIEDDDKANQTVIFSDGFELPEE